MRKNHHKSPTLRLEKLEGRELFSVSTGPGVGWEAEGADLEYVDLNGNGIDDVIAVAYDAPSGANQIRYRIGYDVNSNGVARRWSGIKLGPSLGWKADGAGIAVANLDGDSTPDILFMAYDDPSGGNSFRYMVGYDMNAQGAVSSWGAMQSVSGVGWEADGAGIDVGNFDANPRPDAIFMAYDDPSGANTFRYRIGYNLDSQGRPQYVGAPIIVPGVGWEGAGAGIELGNLDSDPRPDVVMMAYDDPAGANTFRMKIGYNVGPNGQADSWSSPIEVEGLGWRGDGAGIALQDYDRDGADEFVFMAYDDPAGGNSFRFRTHEANTNARRVGSELVIDVGVRGGFTFVNQPSNSTFTVTSPGLDGRSTRLSHSAQGIESIRINGSDAVDVLYNQTSLPSEMYGNGRDDYLIGGSNNDLLSGGSGSDRMWGLNGDDRLYGGRGVDYLYGGNHNDGLFGGVGEKDHLEGGSGADRFLQPQEEFRAWFVSGVRNEDNVRDAASEDATIKFRNAEQQTVNLVGFGPTQFGAGSWTDAEIEKIDVALANLHAHVGNTRLLETANGGTMTFERAGTQVGGSNILGWNGGTVIAFTDPAFNRDLSLWQTVYHEMGHNWDDPSENRFANAFRQISGWDQTNDPGDSPSRATGDSWFYNDSNTNFARDYGRWNPFEDYATTWETYFAEEYHNNRNGNRRIQAKYDNLDRLFATLT